MARKYAILRGKRRPRGLESTGPAAAAAVDPDKAKATGTVTLVQENGAWKLDKESYKSSSN